MPRVVRKCRKMCRKDQGCLYDELLEKRTRANLVTTYDPRDHKDYRSAFKLVDLAANFNEDAHADDESSESEEHEEDSELDSDDEDDEDKGALQQAVAIIGTTTAGKNEAVAREEAMLAKLAEAQLLPMPGQQIKIENKSGALP